MHQLVFVLAKVQHLQVFEGMFGSFVLCGETRKEELLRASLARRSVMPWLYVNGSQTIEFAFKY
jgi:hypothetical protein